MADTSATPPAHLGESSSHKCAAVLATIASTGPPHAETRPNDHQRPTASPQPAPRLVTQDTQTPGAAAPSTAEPEVRYVLSGQPTGWSAMAQVMRSYDEDKVKDTKEDVDTLLVFVSV